MESSSRMRRLLRRNYRGSDHFGAAANHEDLIKMKENENDINSSKAPILAAEVISMEALNEEDEQVGIDTLDDRAYGVDQSGENESRPSEAEQTLHESLDPGDAQVPNDQDLVDGSTAGAGYFPSELDERIVLELPSSMVRPLRVIRGTFQVSLIKVFYDPLICSNSDFLRFQNSMYMLQMN